MIEDADHLLRYRLEAAEVRAHGGAALLKDLYADSTHKLLQSSFPVPSTSPHPHQILNSYFSRYRFSFLLLTRIFILRDNIRVLLLFTEEIIVSQWGLLHYMTGVFALRAAPSWRL